MQYQIFDDAVNRGVVAAIRTMQHLVSMSVTGRMSDELIYNINNYDYNKNDYMYIAFFVILFFIFGCIVAALAVNVYDKERNVEKENTITQKFDSLVNSNSVGIDKNKYDIIIINKEKDEAIKVSRTLNDSAAVELFKSLVAE